VNQLVAFETAATKVICLTNARLRK